LLVPSRTPSLYRASGLVAHITCTYNIYTLISIPNSHLNNERYAIQWLNFSGSKLHLIYSV
jgi:hypothetical protein